jgi:hypothetical protein
MRYEFTLSVGRSGEAVMVRLRLFIFDAIPIGFGTSEK